MYIRTHMGMQKQIDLASFPSLILSVYSSSIEQPMMALYLVVPYRFFLDSPYFFLVLFSALILYKRWLVIGAERI